MNHLAELLLLWQDQTIAPEELVELKKLLADPAQRAKVADELFLTGVVLESLRVQSAAGDIPEEDGEPGAAAPKEKAPAHGATAALRGWRRLSWVAGLAAALLLGFLASSWFSKTAPVSPPAFAQVEQVQGDFFVISNQQMRPAQLGEVLVPGQGLATEGTDSGAVVQMKDAVRLKLGGDTTVFTTAEAEPPGSGGPRLVLEKGDLLVEVNRSLKRKKMTVQTSRGVAVAESAEAALHVSDAAGVVVVRGEVSFHHKATGKSIHLSEGQYPAVTAAGELYAAQLFSGKGQLWTTFPRIGLDTGALGYAVAFSPDGKRLAAVNRPGEGGVRVGPVQGQVPPRELKGEGCVQFSRDGKWLATADKASIRLYDLTHEERVRVLAPKSRKPRVQCLAFSPDGQSLAVGRAAARDGAAEVELWDVASGTVRRGWRAHAGQVTCLAFSPDGKLLASGSHDKAVILWDVENGSERRRVMANSTQPVWSLAFAPSGKRLAIATGPGDFRLSQPGEVALCDVATGAISLRLHGHSRAVTSVLFSADGRTAITGSADTTVRFWDLKTGREYGMLKGHKAAPGFEAVMVALSPDGAALATASFDQTVKLWPTTWIRGQPSSARLSRPVNFLQPPLVALRGNIP